VTIWLNEMLGKPAFVIVPLTVVVTGAAVAFTASA